MKNQYFLDFRLICHTVLQLLEIGKNQQKNITNFKIPFIPNLIVQIEKPERQNLPSFSMKSKLTGVQNWGVSSISVPNATVFHFWRSGF